MPAAPRSRLLWPPPRELRPIGGTWAPAEAIALNLEAKGTIAEAARERLAGELAAAGLRCDPRAAQTVVLRTDAGAGLPREGYRLEVGRKGVRLLAGEPRGLFHGVSTVLQWWRLHAAPGARPELPAVEIDDAPDFADRGVLLDVSRDRVPTMETLFATVDLLASWKVNQLQLYTEHTFAYRGHEAVWRGASPLTPAEVEALDDRCAARGIELVPNQNSLGHLHRWLRMPAYRALAECPEGVEHAWATTPEPFSLCPTDPASLEFLADLYGQLLPHHRSRRLNAGLDETFDLGRGRSAAAVADRGVGRVYLEFLLAVRRLAAGHGRRLQVWGDVVLAHPELITEIPDDVTLLAWGYEADHPFAEETARFAAAGRPFYVCPGTSAWQSFGGRVNNAVANLARAAVAGRAAGAQGYLVTDWGDNGHLQPLPVSWPGLLAGAGFAWRTEAAEVAAAGPAALELAALLDLWAFRDDAEVAGRVAVELGGAYLHTGGRNRNGTALFFLVHEAAAALSASRAAGVTAAGLEHARAAAAAAAATLSGQRMARPDADLVAAELRWAAEAQGAAAALGLARLAAGTERPLADLPGDLRARLAAAFRGLEGQHRELWRERSRPGGLEDSVARLGRVSELLAGAPSRPKPAPSPR